MSISFSGLASGLDTSSWVESLTALKRAKVETYKAEKQNLLLSQQTLSSIKNFFNSFRSVIEKVTDTKFGTGKLDVFSQNLAVSSKTNILTAIANSEAQEGTYTINVNNLASNTQAASNYYHITTQTISQTATLGSTLNSLGVKAGRIGVTVNNSERTVRIGNDETIQSFIEKLNNVGAKASYNESTGSFSLNIRTNDIRDIDNTGIINALHLKGINEGYISNTLQTAVVDTIYEQANLGTKLSELGIVDGYLYLYKNGNKEEIFVDSNQILNDLINSLNSHGINAELSDDGYLSITENSNLYILSDGATHFFEVMGYDPRDTNKDIVSTSQTSKPLHYTTTLVEGTVADRNTKIADIATINNGDTVVVKNARGVTSTITLGSTATIGNLLTMMNDKGLYANIDSNGVVSISDGTIVGGTFDINAAFKLDEEITGSSVTSNPIYINKTIAQDVTSTAQITYTSVRDAQMTDKIKDIYTDWNLSVDVYNSSGILLRGCLFSEDMTFEGLVQGLNSLGYSFEGKMENGVFSLSSTSGHYIKGLEALGINTAYLTNTIRITTAVTRTSGTLYYTTRQNATLSDFLTGYVECNEVYEYTPMKYISTTPPINTSIIKPTSGSNILSVSDNSSTNSLNSLGSGITFPAELTKNTVLAAVGTIVDASGKEHSIIASNGAIVDENGNVLDNDTANSMANCQAYVNTFEDLKNRLGLYGISMTMSDGVISLTSSNGAYVKGDLFEQLGIQTVVTGTRTLTEGVAQTSSSPIYYTSISSSGMIASVIAKSDTTFARLGADLMSSTLAVTIMDNSTQSPRTVTFSPTKTIGDFISILQDNGVNASFSSARGTVTLNGGLPASENYILGISSDLKSILNISDDLYKTTSITAATNSASTTLATVTSGIATGTTMLKDIGQVGNKTITAKYNGNTYTITLNDTMRIGDAISAINNALSGATGISATFTNGQVKFESSRPSQAYITDFGGAFGITRNGYTVRQTTSTTQANTTSDRLQIGNTVTANWNTTMEQLGFTDSNGEIAISNQTGDRRTIFIDKTDTIRDVRDKLATYDIALNCSNGTITLSGTGDKYINGITSNVANAFNLTLRSSSYYTRTKQAITTENIKGVLFEEMYLGDGTMLDSIHFDISKNGVNTGFTIYSNDTIDDINKNLSTLGITATVANGRLQFSGNGEIYFAQGENTPYADTINFDKLGIGKSNWVTNRNYESSAPLGVASSFTLIFAAQRDTKLSDLGVTTGEYCIYNNGVKNTLFISSDDTIGSFINTLKSFGIEAGINTPSNAISSTLYLRGNGNTYLAKSNGSYSSNIVEQLFGSNDIQQETGYGKTLQTETTGTIFEDVTEDTRINDIYTTNSSLINTDTLTGSVNGRMFNYHIGENETIGDLLDKLNNMGFKASLTNNQILVYRDATDSIPYYLTNSANGSLNRLGLSQVADIGYSITEDGEKVATSRVIVEERNDSVANYARHSTKLDLLNISSGSLTIYRNGEKATIQVDSNQTFGVLRSQIAAAFSDVDLKFENGYLTISSNNNAEILVGSTTDTSNFAAITGMHSEDKKSISSRTLYCVNNDSKVTNSGLFARGTVSEGNFKVGNATITINKDTTINDIISQINYNDNSNATAYWDSIEGKFVIKAKTTGSSMINIEAGSSNFTDIMGFTFKEGGKSKMNMNSQQLGQNARFTINGTNFTSTSNTITSDISRIAGVTINLKDITTDEPVTVTVEKDKETAANAVSDIVDAYNELIDNIDKEVSRTGNLSGESTLRLIRNQIRSLMTSSIANTGSFKNLASIGISLSAATSGNIRTDNINTLKFDKDKFIDAFGSDLSSLKSLLVGTDEKQGILTQVENVLEQALGGVTGYFASAEKSYSNKISKLDDKITKTNNAADRYKVRLEAKFKAMDMIISKVQNQYSSFLS